MDEYEIDVVINGAPDKLKTYCGSIYSAIDSMLGIEMVEEIISVKRTIDKDFNYVTALYIGFFQILSLVPGVSRSGIVISGARFFNFGRVDSAKISFLLSIPTLSAVSLFNIQTLIVEKNFYISLINLFGILLSFLFSYITIKFLIKFLQKFSLISFVIYRIFLGLIILFYSYL